MAFLAAEGACSTCGVGEEVVALDAYVAGEGGCAFDAASDGGTVDLAEGERG